MIVWDVDKESEKTSRNDDTQAKSTKEVRRIQGLQKTTNQTPTGCMTSIKVKIAREWNVHAGHQWNVHAGTGADERMESGIDEMNRLRRTKLNANVLKKKLQRWVCRKPRCWAPILSYSWYVQPMYPKLKTSRVQPMLSSVVPEVEDVNDELKLNSDCLYLASVYFFEEFGDSHFGFSNRFLFFTSLPVPPFTPRPQQL